MRYPAQIDRRPPVELPDFPRPKGTNRRARVAVILAGSYREASAYATTRGWQSPQWRWLTAPGQCPALACIEVVVLPGFAHFIDRRTIAATVHARLLRLGRGSDEAAAAFLEQLRGMPS